RWMAGCWLPDVCPERPSPCQKTIRIYMTVINVMAASVDGFVAAHGGQTDRERHAQGFTGSADRAHLESLIRGADAVIAGSQTMMAANGALEVRRHDGTYPLWVTFSNRGIPRESGFWSQSGIPGWVVSENPLVMYRSDVANKVYGRMDPVLYT